MAQRDPKHEAPASGRFALDEVEKVARIGSYSLDVRTGRWTSSKGLDAIFGIDAAFERSVEGWTSLVHPEDRDGMLGYFAGEVLGRGHPFDRQYRVVKADTGESLWVHGRGRLELDASGRVRRMLGTIADITEHRNALDEVRRLEAHDRQLAQAVGATSDSVVLTDLAGRIQYVNAAFERVTGYRRDEVIGGNPRILKSGHHSRAFYDAMWSRLAGGEDWSGTIVNRRKDGSLLEEEATISPIRGPDGEITGYVGLKRDVTALRAAESRLARRSHERAEVTAALGRLHPLANIEATAAQICDLLVSLSGIDLATIFIFTDDRQAVTLAMTGPPGMPLTPGQPVPTTRATYLYERASLGSWAEAWEPRIEDGSYGTQIAAVGIQASAYAPIRNDDGLFGLVTIATRDRIYAQHLVEELPAVGEFASTASALFEAHLNQGNRDEAARKHIREALAEGGLRPVFQPIVMLTSGDVVGYEALTRFADGTPPDRMIAEAHTVRLGRELEIACIAAAVGASRMLASDLMLTLNVSPSVLLETTELGDVLRHRRRTVLEITEHVKIDDYAAVRAARAALGSTVELAIDDAGAGFASLHHIVELTPQFLKVDISLVRDVHLDPARQAMVAGLVHFAGRTGCQVIAEGIEQPAELDMLRELGVALGQGYLIGRPGPLPARSSRTLATPPGSRASRRIPAERPAADGCRARA